jgi:hypothetical protein
MGRPKSKSADTGGAAHPSQGMMQSLKEEGPHTCVCDSKYGIKFNKAHKFGEANVYVLHAGTSW